MHTEKKFNFAAIKSVIFNLQILIIDKGLQINLSVMSSKMFFQKYPILGDIIKAIVISLIAIIVIMLVLRFFTSHGKEYQVPDFNGYTLSKLEDFKQNKNDHGFELTINDSVFIPDVKGGVVISQDPQAGMKVKKGRKIYLSVSMMVPPKVEMPNLIDLSLRQAMNMLESNNLKLGQVIHQPSKFPNAVLEQRYKGKIIKEGKMIPYHSEITLVVGKEVDGEGSLDDIQISQ